MAEARPRVLVLSDHYLPAFRAGGPVRSLANLVERLGDRVDFHVVTRLHDFGGAPLPGVRADAWQPVGRAQVYYASRPSSPSGGVRAALGAGACDVLYFNSLFSPHFTLRPLLLRRLGRLPPRPVVVAPRGELYPGALAQKRAKKLAFLAAARLAGLYRGVTWQATSADEAEQVRRWFGAGARVVRAGNLGAPPPAHAAGVPPRPAKHPGRLKIAFLSRIAPKKNLAGALELLAGVDGEVELDAWGPHEDPAYLARCRAAAAALPPQVRVRFPGEVEHAGVERLLAGYHLFLLPTQGENFGHAIAEALRAGVPVLISDRTPWRGLVARGAGWDLPLERPDEFRRVLRECVAMDGAAWSALAEGARRYGVEAASGAETEDALLRLFAGAAAPGGAP